MVTPSRVRSRPARQVLAPSPSELVRGPVRRVEAPPDPGSHHPLLEPARSSSSKPNRRRTGSRPARSSTWEAVTRARQLEQLGDDAENGVGLAQRTVGEPYPQVGKMCRASVSSSMGSDGTEGGVDERCVRLDVGAHDDHVAGLEVIVIVEQVEDGVAQDFDLAGPPVAGMDLDAAVVSDRGEVDVVVAGSGTSGR